MSSYESKNLPKILVVGPTPPLIGGIATYISDLVDSNLSKEFELILFTTNRPGNKRKIPTLHNYKLIFHFSLLYLTKSIIITFYHLLVFPYVLIFKFPNLVHVHTSSYWSFLENSFYILVSKMFRKKVVVHIHASDFDNFYLTGNSLMKQYIRFVVNKADRIVALSEYWKNFFIKEMLLDINKISIIRNGVKLSKYKKETNSFDTNEKMNILFMGGMDAKRKGAYEVVKAIPLVIKRHPNVIFTFIGKGQTEIIKKMCRDNGVEENTRVLGEVSEDRKIKELKSSHIFLLPSYAEGLPISILESMGSGLPVISTTVGAIPEVIDEGVNGYLIDPGDYRTLADRILLLIENESLRNRISKKNVKKIEDEYDMSVVVNSVINVYKSVIS